MVQCGACGKFMNAREGVTCPKCKSKSHYECVRVPVGVEVSESWRCGDCQIKTPKGRDPCTPIRGLQDNFLGTKQETSTVAPSVDNSEQYSIEMVRALRDEMRSEFSNMNKLMTNEFKTSKDKIGNFFNEIKEMRQELAATRSLFNERLASYDARLETLEQAQSQTAAAPKAEELSALQQALDDLKTQLNEREQESFLNDVLITGIPEQKGENPSHLATLLGTKLGLSIDDRDIVMSEREGVTRRSQDSSSSAPRVRRLVVRFARRDSRDAYLRAARVRRGLTTSDLGLEGAPVRIYVNERLTKKNGQLFAKAREECRAHDWKYSWTRHGHIFVRKEHGSSFSRIRSEKDLDRIFGTGSV